MYHMAIYTSYLYLVHHIYRQEFIPGEPGQITLTHSPSAQVAATGRGLITQTAGNALYLTLIATSTFGVATPPFHVVPD